MGEKERGRGSGANIPITGNYILGGPLSGHESIKKTEGIWDSREMRRSVI